MTEEQAHGMSQAESAREIDRIRDIIFGSQIQDYEQRFQTIQHDLDRVQQGIDRLTKQLGDQDSSQAKRLEAFRGKVQQMEKDLRNELREATQTLTTDKVDRVQLGRLFIELGTLLKTDGSLKDVLEGLQETE
jgi:predicted  nucleic acid-binding Zn-ribbon protein